MLAACVIRSRSIRRWAVLPQRVALSGLEFDSELSEMRLASAAGNVVEVSENSPSSRLSRVERAFDQVFIAVRLEKLSRFVANQLHGLDVCGGDAGELGDPVKDRALQLSEPTIEVAAAGAVVVVVVAIHDPGVRSARRMNSTSDDGSLELVVGQADELLTLCGGKEGVQVRQGDVVRGDGSQRRLRGAADQHMVVDASRGVGGRRVGVGVEGGDGRGRVVERGRVQSREDDDGGGDVLSELRGRVSDLAMILRESIIVIIVVGFIRSFASCC